MLSAGSTCIRQGSLQTLGEIMFTAYSCGWSPCPPLWLAGTIFDISTLLNTRANPCWYYWISQQSLPSGPASAESRSFSCKFYSVNMCYLLHSSVIRLAELTLKKCMEMFPWWVHVRSCSCILTAKEYFEIWQTFLIDHAILTFSWICRTCIGYQLWPSLLLTRGWLQPMVCAQPACITLLLLLCCVVARLFLGSFADVMHNIMAFVCSY